MSKKINYEEVDLGRLEKIDDFLPKPEELVSKRGKVKVTMELSKESVDFFKGEAIKYKVPYQMMIRNLLDRYAKKFNSLTN